MTQMVETKKWYVAHTQSHEGAKPVTHLERQSFATYLKRRSHGHRVNTIAAPLYSRYLFVSIDLAVQRWLSIPAKE
jgi:transcriptional antiterminator RfaH